MEENWRREASAEAAKEERNLYAAVGSGKRGWLAMEVSVA